MNKTYKDIQKMIILISEKMHKIQGYSSKYSLGQNEKKHIEGLQYLKY